MVHELQALAELDRNAAGLKGKRCFFASASRSIVVEENLDADAALVGAGESLRELGMGKSEHGAGDGMLSAI